MLKAAFVFSCLLVINASSYAEELYQVGRYTSIEPVATSQQADLLSVVVTVNFTDQVNTVGDAMHHILLRSGYRLASQVSSDPALPILLDSSLPLVHRTLGPIRIDNALSTLAGPAWDLVVDPVNRLVSFDLLEQYRSLSVSLAHRTKTL
jgi:type IV pili sensor histidine kinase/response regulator